MLRPPPLAGPTVPRALLLWFWRGSASAKSAACLMRRVGLVFLALGLAGFLFASHAAGGRPGAWDDARWAMLGIAVMGVVFVVLPGKEGA